MGGKGLWKPLSNIQSLGGVKLSKYLSLLASVQCPAPGGGDTSLCDLAPVPEHFQADSSQGLERSLYQLSLSIPIRLQGSPRLHWCLLSHFPAPTLLLK